jgi:GDP-D-mannose dehydratase
MSDRAKVQRTLGWKPTGAFPDLVREMVEAELAAIDEGGEMRRSVVTINE